MRRDLKLTADPKMGHFIAQPRERGPQHRSHPHHYVATMIAFFGLAAVFVFLIIAQIARYW